MDLSGLMKSTMPHSRLSLLMNLRFSGSLKSTMGFGNASSEDFTMRTIMLASMTNSYVEGSAKLIGACGQTVRNHLADKDPENLLRINGDLIATARDMGLLRKPMIVAMDWHDEMYYGDRKAEGIIGTKNRAGTNYAYEYATASAVIRGERFVVAVIPIRERTILGMVAALTSSVESLGIRIRVLLLDGGFYSIDLINYLNAGKISFVIHAPKLKKECGNNEVDMEYSTKSHRRRKKEQASFRVVSIYGHSRKGRMLYIFATNMQVQPKYLLKLHRKRWGIETGYRMIRRFLARTTSKRLSVRLLYFYLAMLLYNIWVMINIGSSVRIMADGLKVLIASSLIRENPFVMNIIPYNGRSGGDF